MTDTVSAALSTLRGTADRLDQAARTLPATDPGATAFGAGGPGRLGEATREVYQVWSRALDARAREAAAHAERLVELADLAGRAAGGLREVNERSARGANENATRPEVS